MSTTMELELDQTLSPEFGAHQAMKVSPRLVAASHILELSSQELQQAIAAELHDNPALELVDIPTCRVCGTELHGSICPRCIQRQKTDSRQTSAGDGGSPAFDEISDSRRVGSDEEVFDPLTRVASEETLAERLMSDLGSVLSAGDMPIAEYLIGSLDDKGYLAARVEDVAYEVEVDVDRVRSVLGVLQSQDPIGIGARNLRECLLIQIDHLDQRGVSQPMVREIVGQFLTELAEHKFSRIANELKVSPDAVSDAWEFVKQKLNPHPAHGFSPTNARDRDTQAMYIAPDVTISRGKDDAFEIEMVESRRFALRINPMYTRLAEDLRHPDACMNLDEKKHVQHYAGRARMFIANITQRRQTMLKITRCIVDRQRGYLEHGVRRLVPLSRAAVAEQLGVHESTVSRATASKYAMLPNGEVIPYAHFFTPSLSVKDILKEVVEKEGKPLTDSDIRERLDTHGIHIARRTVAKYRMQLAILRSALR
ncbi:MAG: RNA polymerase factor sigma-54 [Chloroflexota bacterium]|nr:RNA polymerase factor sigma-54 [Chloroflexota bacterium]